MRVLSTCFALASAFSAFLLAGCGGGGGGSVNNVPGGPIPSKTPLLLIGDNTNDTNTVQLAQTLSGNGYAVSIAPSIPNPTDASVTNAKVIVISESAQISQGNAPTVKGLLDSGKGVVLLGRVPVVLATGNRDLPADLSSISTWFGGATNMQPITEILFADLTSLDLKVQSNNLVNLPAGFANGDSVYGGGDDDVANPNAYIPYIPDDAIGPNTAQVLKFKNGVFAFAYNTPSNGRLYWQWSASGRHSDTFAKLQAVFFAGTRWAAGLQK